MSSALAEKRVRDFQNKYDDVALHLAYHAALPVALTADLLHLLRINFFLDPPNALPYTAEFELLLSPLCREIDEGLYEIQPEIRDILLQELYSIDNGQRLRDVATLLWQYMERDLVWSDRIELERAQQLTVLNFLDPIQAKAWLEQLETEIDDGLVTEKEWYVAMLQEIDRPKPGFSTLRTKIIDAEVLKNALLQLGISVKLEADLRGYQGQRVMADVVAVLEGEYDIGWSRNSDGSFDLIGDLWGVAKKYNQTELLNDINQKYTELLTQEINSQKSHKIFSNLPHRRYSHFIGREREISTLLDRLSPNYKQSVTSIQGVGGIGKTSLAIEVAYRCLEVRNTEHSNHEIPNFDAFIFTSAKNIDLINSTLVSRPEKQLTLADIFQTIAETLENRSIHKDFDLQQRQNLVYLALSMQPTLLIIDNFEMFSDEEKNIVLHFIKNLHVSTKVIITTREQLEFSSIFIPGLNREESVELVTTKARSKNVKLNILQAERIYEKCQGIPLAIIYVLGKLDANYDLEDILTEDLEQISNLTQKPLRSKKTNSTKAAKDIQRSQETQKLRSTIRVSRDNKETIKTLRRLGVIAKGDNPSITDISSLLNRANQNSEVTIEAIKTLGKIGKNSSIATQALVRLLINDRNLIASVEALKSLAKTSTGEASTIQSICNLLTVQKNTSIEIEAINTITIIAKGNRSAIQKVISLWPSARDRNLKKSIVSGLGEIANGDKSAIDQLISILRLEKDSVLIQLTADSLGKIAVGDLDAIQALEMKLKTAPAKPKILRINLLRNLKKIDSDNKLAAEYANRL